VTSRALILVVEDDSEVRAFMAEALMGAGFDVLEAADGWQALEVVGSRRPALAILDMMLPGIDGEAVASALAVMEGVPVLLVTGGAEPSTLAARMGAYAYLRKPFGVDTLIRTVREGLTP
jgi:two-component system response regulator VicR